MKNLSPIKNLIVDDVFPEKDLRFQSLKSPVLVNQSVHRRYKLKVFATEYIFLYIIPMYICALVILFHQFDAYYWGHLLSSSYS